MSIKTACIETASILRTVTALKRVYSAGEEGVNGIPDALSDQVPSAIVYPGEMVNYEQGPSEAERHEYNLKIQVFVNGADTANKINNVIDVFDTIKVAFQQATALNDISAAIRAARITSWRFGSLTYGSETFTGWEITLFVSEDSSVGFGR